MTTKYTIHSEFVHHVNGEITRSRYIDGSLALTITSEIFDGDMSYPETETLSINLGPAYGLTPPEDHIYVRNYSQHAGLPEALAAAGIATLVEVIHFGPYSIPGALMKINEGVGL